MNKPKTGDPLRAASGSGIDAYNTGDIITIHGFNRGWVQMKHQGIVYELAYPENALVWVDGAWELTPRKDRVAGDER